MANSIVRRAFRAGMEEFNTPGGNFLSTWRAFVVVIGEHPALEKMGLRIDNPVQWIEKARTKPSRERSPRPQGAAFKPA